MAIKLIERMNKQNIFIKSNLSLNIQTVFHFRARKPEVLDHELFKKRFSKNT